MPILQDSALETITTGWRALNLFTDRYEAIRRFAEYLQNDPSPERILFFSGDGGNGKSLFLRFLHTHCCKHLSPEDWAYVRANQGEAFVTHLRDAQDAKPVPTAALDFGMQPRDDESPQEAFSGLWKLRRDLAGQGLSFPLYDFACIWYFHKTGKLNGERLKNLFPPEEVGFLMSLANMLLETKPGKLATGVLSLFNKHLRQQFTVYRQRRKLDEDEVGNIQRMDLESEFLDCLPHLFAKDLSAAMSLEDAPERVVLFFDTHEAFWGATGRVLSGDLYFQRDEWLRRLLGTLELQAGIVAVVAGRESPRWEEASRIKIPALSLDVQKIAHFSDTDGMSYLEKAGVTDEAMRQELVNYARVAPDEVHPFYVSLCADVVLAANDQGTPLTPMDFRDIPQIEQKEKELMERLLRYVDREVDMAVRALSACRAFNHELYALLGQALGFQATPATFAVLTEFSFMWQAESRGEGWYRIHDLLRGLLRERETELTQRVDAILEQHYRGHADAGDVTAVAEAIYHANKQDWQRGINEWTSVFDEALRLSRYDFCRALLDIREELSLDTPFGQGQVFCRAGDYFASLSRHVEAQQEYLEAITAYDAILQRAPDNVAARNNKALALVRLGNVQARLSQYPEATQSYAAATTAFDETLQRAPDYVIAHNNKGNTLASLGDVQAGLSQHSEAIQSYTTAIIAYDEALLRAPDDIYAHNNKGSSLASLGNVQAELSHHSEAIQSYTAAITTFDEILQRAPDDVAAHNNKALALVRLGNVQARLSQYPEATQSYTAAITAYAGALQRAPDYVQIHTNIGNALMSLGDVQAELSQHSDATQSYIAAITAMDEALLRAPDEVGTHNNKGIALQRLGNVQARLSQYPEATQSYIAAITAMAEALLRASD